MNPIILPEYYWKSEYLKYFIKQIFDRKFLKSVMNPILLHRVILNFDKQGFNHEFLIFFPHTTKKTLRDIIYQISGKMANINYSYNRK